MHENVPRNSEVNLHKLDGVMRGQVTFVRGTLVVWVRQPGQMQKMHIL